MEQHEQNQTADEQNPLGLKYLFTDPFHTPKEYDKNTVGRVTFDIPKDVHNLFYRLLPYKSAAVFQTTFTILTHKLIKALKANGYKFNSDEGEQFKQFVQQCSISLPNTLENLRAVVQRTSPLGTMSETLPPHDSGRTNGKGSGDTDSANKQSNLPGQTSRTSTRGSGRRGGRKSGTPTKGEGSGSQA